MGVEITCIKLKDESGFWGVTVKRPESKVPENYIFEEIDCKSFGWLTCFEVSKKKLCFTILHYDTLRVWE